MKKILALLLAAVLLFSVIPLTSAAESTMEQQAAENLHALGLLAGVGTNADGSVNFDVNGSLTRAQSVVQIVRFLGAEKTATTESNANPFTDLAAWAVPYVSYAYANGITSGRSATVFDPDTAMNDAGFLTLLLRVLGYEDKNDGSGDFVWSDPYTAAASVGLIDTAAPDANFTRGDAFIICYRALTATVKNGDKLCDRLVKAGTADAETMASVLKTAFFDGLTIGSAPITSASVVIGKDASATEKQMAQNLIDDIQKAYDVTLPLLTDETAKSGAEIVIGETARAISLQVTDLAKLEAAMIVSGDSLALRAATNAKLHSLTDWFSDNYIAGKPTIRLTEAHTKVGELLTNPLRTDPSGDPCIEYDPETGYYYALYSSPNNDRVILYRAKHLSGLGTAEGKEIYVAGDDQEIKYKLFAPELVKVDGKWYIYASGAMSWADINNTVSRYTRLFCLEAVSDDPYGDYVFKGFLDKNIWSIDAHVFTWEGENYVAFARCTGKNHIAIARLKNPWTLDATRVTTIASPELPFETIEGYINEGPHTFVSPDGRLFILYAANSVTDKNYCLGLLEFTGEDILAKSSWTKTEYAVFKGTDEILSPGHCSVFLSPDGTEYWLAYHYRGGTRILAAQQITFDANGDPVFSDPLSPNDVYFAPSGED
ncbi:MAG: family 43 glycosylhydrolase [Clostridia bacterium]|nr:family 43 glycosylhydrolase [Clostridia bacterium]